MTKTLTEQDIDILQKAVSQVLGEFELSEVKALDDGSNTFKVIASDESVDRDGEIIKVD